MTLLMKAKSLPIGSKRRHGGILKIKTGKGWVPVSEEKKLSLAFGKFEASFWK